MIRFLARLAAVELRTSFVYASESVSAIVEVQVSNSQQTADRWLFTLDNKIAERRRHQAHGKENARIISKSGVELGVEEAAYPAEIGCTTIDR